MYITGIQKMPKRNQKKESGAFYRKQKRAKLEEKQKLSGSLEQFFKTTPEPELQTASPLSFERPSTSTAVLSDPEDTKLELLEDSDEDTEECDDDTVTSGDTIEATISDCNFDTTDTGAWPTILTNRIIDIIVEKGPFQIREYNFPTDDSRRKFSVNLFSKTLSNGEKVNRSWLVYSPKLNSAFCFCCKLFAIKNREIKLITGGYSDWRHAVVYFSEHDRSSFHIHCLKKWSELKLRYKQSSIIDKEEQSFYEREKKKWRAIIERMVAIVQYLAGQCLAFRGESCQLFAPNNGNFLKLIEMLSKFDPIIAEHLNNVQKSKDFKLHMPSYLGNKIQNEIIALLSEEVVKHIISNVKKAKYYSIILDCTPDVSHVEQISVIARFVKISEKEAEIQEQFLGFFPCNDSTGKGLCNFVLTELLPKFDLEIQNLRGQGYDNGANMKGKNSGLQKKILEINPRAIFVPCLAHTLNLVVNDAAKINNEIVSFFDVVQELYVFFSSSVARWRILKTHVPSLSLKPLSDTRWESRVNAIKPLISNLKNICDSLAEIAHDDTKDIKSRGMAQSILEKITVFKFICSIVIWYNLLTKVNVISKLCQSPKVEISECLKTLNNLCEYIQKIRSDEGFEQFIQEGKSLAEKVNVTPEFSLVRRKRVPRQFSYESKDEPVLNELQHFKITFYFSILDTTIQSIQERFSSLNQCNNLFKFLYDFDVMEKEEIKKCCIDFDKCLQHTEGDTLQKDVDGNEVYHEIMSLKEIMPTLKSPQDILDYIIKNDIVSCFPNLSIAIRIFLTLPVTVASGERSFSKLRLIKNYLRSTMSQERLTNLAMISIEQEICQNLDPSHVIDSFASKKARRVLL